MAGEKRANPDYKQAELNRTWQQWTGRESTARSAYANNGSATMLMFNMSHVKLKVTATLKASNIFFVERKTFARALLRSSSLQRGFCAVLCGQWEGSNPAPPLYILHWRRDESALLTPLIKPGLSLILVITPPQQESERSRELSQELLLFILAQMFGL